ncbi:hypothetical protein [Metabacillus sp. FJAT-52054]|uniref:Uncharacterized protein n=1 Tax=Metabacillus sediminis TaxID=3117746 RepID=A0ABZ2NI08_9BACI
MGIRKSSIELMLEGYEKSNVDKKEVQLNVINKDDPKDRPLSPIEKMSAGYQCIQDQLAANQEKYLQEKGGNK